VSGRRYLPQLLHVLLVRAKHRSEILAASAVSALGSLVELSKWAVLPSIEELLSCGVGLSLSEHVSVVCPAHCTVPWSTVPRSTTQAPEADRTMSDLCPSMPAAERRGRLHADDE
jgi:hypothetical protein